MKIVKLAFRNVFRNKRRSLVSIFVLMIGVMGLGIFSGFMHFTFWGIKERIIHVGMGTPEGTGHFQIFNSDFLQKEESRPFEYGISGWKDLINEVERIPEVYFAAPRIDMMGLLSNGDKAEPVVGFAVAPGKEKYLPGIFSSALPYIELENSEDGVILGVELANKMNAKKGEYLTLMSATSDGAINAIDLKYLNSINTGTPEGDSRFILINLKSALDLIQTDMVRKIVVVLREKDWSNELYNEDSMNMIAPDKLYFEADTEKPQKIIADVLADRKFTLKRWKELNGYYDSVKDLYNIIFGFIGVVMAIVVILSIYNTMFMAVVERTQEIGTLMAVGTPRRYVLLLFLLEGLIIAVIGGVLGYGGTYVMSDIISNAGLTMPPPPGGTTGYPLIVHKVYLWWLYTVLFIMFNTVVACFIPALRAARMPIVKALYHA